MDDREILIDYEGELNYTHISKILTELKEKIFQKKETIHTYKRLLSITDESLENISMYIDSYPEEYTTFKKFPSGYQLSLNSNLYRITTRNPLKISDRQNLTNKIDHINFFSEDELKLLYKKTISNGKFSKQGGAGLGLLIIAKSSCKKINYTFEQINQEFFYFSLIIEITK
jgi:hypothetical protein